MMLFLLLSSFLTLVELNCENLFDCRHDSLKNDLEFVRQQGAEEKGSMTIQEFADFINNTVREQMSAY